MKKIIITFFCVVATRAFAYNQAVCMSGIEESAMFFKNIGNENINLSGLNSNFLKSQNYREYEMVDYLSRYIDLTLLSETHVSAILALRKFGSYKKPELADRVAKSQFIILYNLTKELKNISLKYSEDIRNIQIKSILTNIYGEAFKAEDKLKFCE